LQQVDEATRHVGRVAAGMVGTLRVGFSESASWHGVVPRVFRRFRSRQPDAELRLSPMNSLEQIEAIRSRELDAGFLFEMPESDPELERFEVASQELVLALPKGHPLSRLKNLRLRDLTQADFVWFPRRRSPAFYDRLLQACSRGGLESPRIVQEAVNEATMLSLVACRLGLAFVTDATQWRCPRGVVLRRVVDLRLPITFSLVWRKDNSSPLLARLVSDVMQLPRARRNQPGV
jgi:DNA-binding transcriptional LysR family regulator